ncbi:hypothetical protein NL323_30460, partial [Klebsiella pneumoniae]|nr:hypothetical protein [Klebsiella pneumoniae]
STPSAHWPQQPQVGDLYTVTVPFAAMAPAESVVNNKDNAQTDFFIGIPCNESDNNDEINGLP